MLEVQGSTNQTEVHDPAILAHAKTILDACRSPQEMQEAVLAAVTRNEEWRGKRCLNLLAPEALTSPMVRGLLSAEVGTRAAEGHIGPVNRWFAGTQHIDEIEALCIELLKKAFRSRYADHRLVASMIGNMAVYTALTEPGDIIMSIAQPFGGHSSNRVDGPAGVRGLKIVDIPFDPIELEVDLDLFRKVAPLVRPKVVALGASMTLFPFPIQAISDIVAEWDGKVFFDGAHQLGLIAGGQFQDPLREGAAVMTGSAGKTFSGPQSGIIVWDDQNLTVPLTDAIFPMLAATHQVNGAHKGYTATHQVIANVRQFGGGWDVAQRLARANIITNKNLIPTDRPEDWDHPSGLRIGTTEVTRLGMKEKEMETIADFMTHVLVEKVAPEKVVDDVVAFREPYQTLYYCFDHGLPA